MRQGIAGLRTMARSAIDRLDPASPEVREKEPLSIPFAVLFVCALALSVAMLYAVAYEPGRDIGYHMLCMRIVSEMGTASPLAARYEPLHLTEPNTLMYAVGGLLGKVVGAPAAFRALRLFYFWGLPLVTLYVLRRLGRSAWSALLAFPMEYMQAYAGGFANFSFSAPLFLLALFAFHRLLAEPTRRRAAIVAALTTLVFLAHAHTYLWLGALFLGLFVPFLRRDRRPSSLALVLLSGAPSLLLFVLWYRRTFGAGHAVSQRVIATSAQAFGATWEPLERKLTHGVRWGTDVTQHAHEPLFALWIAAVVVSALVVRRLFCQKVRAGFVFEGCAIATFASYWLLPDSLSGQQVSMRAWDMTAWLVPFLVFVPEAANARARTARVALCAVIALYSFVRMRDIAFAIYRFNDDEVRGFDAMLAAAPKGGDHVVAWAVQGVDSRHVVWLPFYEWHQMFGAMTGIEAPLYDIDRDSNSPIRYTVGPPAPPRLMIDEPDWPAHEGLWQGYDLVLSYRWAPTPEALAVAREHATLLAESNRWQLWQRRDASK